MKHIISLGAGVQSSTLALMAAKGEITPMPDLAVFADTQSEPPSVYRWLDWLETQLPFPVQRVTAGNLGADNLVIKENDGGREYSRLTIPIWTRNPDGSATRLPTRNCTIEYKINPIHKFLKEWASVRRGQKEVSIITWMGISLDEVTRMKPSKVAWSEHRFPLIEAGMRRTDCLIWMEENHYPQPPRSSCVFCPFHNNFEWRRLKMEEPDEFNKAVEFEKDLQNRSFGRNAALKAIPFLHRSCVPLDQIDFRSAEEMGQLNLFENECEGMCGI
jgi:hypothetical protein